MKDKDGGGGDGEVWGTCFEPEEKVRRRERERQRIQEKGGKGAENDENPPRSLLPHIELLDDLQWGISLWRLNGMKRERRGLTILALLLK